MQKECFSLPAIKATKHYFLYKRSKNIYLYKAIYKYIPAKVYLEELLHAIQPHGSTGENDNGAQQDLQWSGSTDGYN